MARDRSRQKQDDRRRRSGSPPLAPDPIGRLDDVLATLEEMLDGRGVPPALEPGRDGAGAAGAAGPRAARETGAPDSLPVLQDVVAPVVNGAVEDGEAGAREAGATGKADDALRREEGPPEITPELPGHEPLPLGFEIVPEDPIPRIGDLDLGLQPPDLEPPRIRTPRLELLERERPDPEPARAFADPGRAEPSPGPDPAEGSPDGDRYGGAPPPSLAPDVYRHLIDRLANEIDVIVQTGTEEAMKRAAVDIADRVREHVAIILPEVIEELVRMSRRPPD